MTDTKAAAIAAIDRVQRYGYATPSDYASIREHFTGKREEQLMTDTAADWAAPAWDRHERIHCWRNYISAEVRAMWHTFTPEQQQALARQAQAQADEEEWG